MSKELLFTFGKVRDSEGGTMYGKLISDGKTMICKYLIIYFLDLKIQTLQ